MKAVFLPSCLSSSCIYLYWLDKRSLPKVSGLLHILLTLSIRQSPDCSLPGPFLKVMFTDSSLKRWCNVCFWNPEQVCLLLAIKMMHSPSSVFQLWCKPTVCRALSWTLPQHPYARMRETSTNLMMLLLLSVHLMKESLTWVSCVFSQLPWSVNSQTY